MKATSASTASKLSLVAAFDELARNGNVLNVGAEAEFAAFVRKSQTWLRKWRETESNRVEMAESLRNKDKEALGLDAKIKQARKLVEIERRQRIQAEFERDEFAKQLDSLKEILLSGNGNGKNRYIDDETLERVRHINTTVTRKTNASSPLKEGGLNVVDESVESLLDASDFSFEETRDESRVFNTTAPKFAKNNQNKRRSSGKIEKRTRRSSHA